MRKVARRRLTVGALVVTVAAVVAVVIVRRSSTPAPIFPECLATAQGGSFLVYPDQAENAATIAAVGRRLGLPDHAVTIALATALQESKLRNLPYGDRDSVGLFQQRPSQGWGARNTLLVPRQAALAFYQHLVHIPGWQQLPVTVAAQRVQHSAAPDGYAVWETDARVLAQAFTGEVGAGLACHLPPATTRGSLAAARALLIADRGRAPIGVGVSTQEGWATACWLVGNAQRLSITQVEFGRMRWTAASGKWVSSAAASDHVVRAAFAAPKKQ